MAVRIKHRVSHEVLAKGATVKDAVEKAVKQGG